MSVQTPVRADRRAVSLPNPQAAQEAQRGSLLRGARARVALVRIAFGLIWALDAWYKWQPAFQKRFASMITRPAQTAPASLHGWFHFWSNLVGSHAGFFAPATAAGETLIAACLILGVARRPLYLLGAVFSFLIWSVPEAFGHFWTAGQTDLGTSIMYVFIFLALYVLDARSSAGEWSVDRCLEARLPFWRVVAEP